MKTLHSTFNTKNLLLIPSIACIALGVAGNQAYQGFIDLGYGVLFSDLMLLSGVSFIAIASTVQQQEFCHVCPTLLSTAVLLITTLMTKNLLEKELASFVTLSITLPMAAINTLGIFIYNDEAKNLVACGAAFFLSNVAVWAVNTYAMPILINSEYISFAMIALLQYAVSNSVQLFINQGSSK